MLPFPVKQVLLLRVGSEWLHIKGFAFAILRAPQPGTARNLGSGTLNVELPGKFLEKNSIFWKNALALGSADLTEWKDSVEAGNTLFWKEKMDQYVLLPPLWTWAPSISKIHMKIWTHLERERQFSNENNYFGISYHRSFSDQFFSPFHFWNKYWKKKNNKNDRNSCKPALLAPHPAPETAQPCPRIGSALRTNLSHQRG